MKKLFILFALLPIFVTNPMFAQLPPALFADQPAYAPGATAVIAGSGFQPGEVVALQLLQPDGSPAPGAYEGPWQIAADATGNFLTGWVVCQEDCPGTTIALAAIGEQSGATALTTFLVDPLPSLLTTPLAAEVLLTDACPSGAGELDPTFNAGSAVDDTVHSVVFQPDGKVIIGGLFTIVNHAVRSKVARLNADGSTDFTFMDGLAGVNANGEVYSVVLQPDGKVLVGGFFSSVNGAARFGIARLNSDGTLDTTFQNGMSGVASGIIHSMALQPDGKVLIGGTFTVVNGAARGRFARLNSDGSLDIAFAGAANSTVRSIVLQPDGQVLIGGSFTIVNGSARNRIARLNHDGSLDLTFQNAMTGASPGEVFSVALETDGQVLIGGSFNTVNGATRNRIARLNSDGTLDTSFQNGMAGGNGRVLSVALQRDDRVLIGGEFTTINGTTRNGIARLNADGSLDTTFQSGMSGVAVASAQGVNSVVLQPDGQVLIGGQFFLVNDTSRHRIARLNPDGSLDTTFQNGPPGPDLGVTPPMVESVVLQPDGKVLIGGSFMTVGGVTRNRIARLNSNGRLDSTFQNGLAGATGPGGVFVYSAALQPDGKVLVGGRFTAMNGIARGSLARLNNDGSLDTTFQNGMAGLPLSVSPVLSVMLQADGQVLIGGLFSSVNGVARTNIARLNRDGSVDATFQEGMAGANGRVFAIAPQDDGRVLIGGEFTSVNGVARNGIARLTADGNLDPSFQNAMVGAVPARVFSLHVQPDGQVLLGGWFSSVNGVPRAGIARLNGSDGRIDTTFQAGVSPAQVQVVKLQPDGKLLIGGLGFTLVNGVSRFGITRLNNNGSLDTAFQNGLPGVRRTGSGNVGSVKAMALQPDGSIVIGGEFELVNGLVRERVARLFGSGDDVTPPTMSCPPNQVISTDPGRCSAVVNYPTPAASDDCSTAIVSCAPPAGSSFPKGTTTVACIATDAAGNTAGCSFMVTVNDNQPPVLTGCPASASFQCLSQVPAASVTANDNCDGAVPVQFNETQSNPGSSCNHTITRIWTATDTSGNTASCSQTITVNDTTPPSITCPPDISVQCLSQVPAPGAVSAMDNCDASVTVTHEGDVQSNPGSSCNNVITRTYKATDACGNSSTCTQTITVNDTTPPTITCSTNVIAPGGQGTVVIYPDPALDDNCGAATFMCAPASGSTFPVGTTTVTCIATDTCANTAQCSFTVTVQSASCEDIQSAPESGRVHFNPDGTSEFAFFRGNLEMTGGNLAPDFRVVPGSAAKGTLKVTIADTVVYSRNNLTFAVHDHDASDNREKWTYNAGPKEKMFLRWKDDQAYDATRDPNVPVSSAIAGKNIGKLETRFIHEDETRFRYNFKDATRPITITVDGIVLLTVRTDGSVASPFPNWKYGKVVEVLFPDRLVSGTVIAWYADGYLGNNGGVPQNLIYQHEASANGNATDTYFNAGGRFFIKVPVTGVNLNALPRNARVEFSLGQQGVTLVGCSEFTVSAFTVVGKNWKFNDGPDDGEEDDDDDHDRDDEDDD